MQVKLGDFGMSRTMGPSPSNSGADGGNTCPALERTLTPNVIGTAAYSAPEVLGSETPCGPGAGGRGRGRGEGNVRRVLKADVRAKGVERGAGCG